MNTIYWVRGHLSVCVCVVSDVERVLELDFGRNNEFYPLRGECYEYTDREYTYKMCPFEKCTQRNKHGGVETTLGWAALHSHTQT